MSEQKLRELREALQILWETDKMMTVSQALALVAVALAGDGVFSTAIVTRTGMDKATVSRMVGYLRDQKWLTKQACEDDERRRALSLTPGGKELVERMARQMAQSL